MTERYLRQSPVAGDVPQIYPGTLRGVTMALKDAFTESCESPVEQRVWAIHRNRLRNLLAIYADGERVWSPSDDDGNEPV